VPFGMSLAKFRETMEKTLLAHYVEMPDPANPGTMVPDPKKTRLFTAKKNATDPDEPLALDTKESLRGWDKYTDADINGALVYFPSLFEKENHGGRTKQELLATTKQGFQILLIEANPFIPALNTNEVIGTKQPRKRWEANYSSNDYLYALQTMSSYSHEQGLTPEAWMTQFLLHLEETNQVIDDYQRNGKINLNLGGWFPAYGNVADGCWDHDSTRVGFAGYDPKNQNSYYGSRTAVRI